MLEDISQAFNQEDFQKAKKLLEQFSQQQGDNPWVQYYHARLEETDRDLDKAEQSYRRILRDTNNPNPKLISKIRSGIDRISKIRSEQKEKELDQFKAIPNSDELAVLILEPVASEDKKIAAQKLAQITQIDVYSARMQIPSRCWRIYRSGNLGELSYYTSRLQDASIPCFCVGIKSIEQLRVYQAKYINSVSPQIVLVCENDLEQEEEVTFAWEEVSNRVEGFIPLLEDLVNVSSKGELERKTKTLDYAQFCDLHLLERNLIVRFSDHTYKFEQGVNFLLDEKTASGKWKNLTKFFAQNTSDVSLWSDFTLFGEGAVEFPEMLKQINSHIHLFGRDETAWNVAFHLYSGLVFLRSSELERMEKEKNEESDNDHETEDDNQTENDNQAENESDSETEN